MKLANGRLELQIDEQTGSIVQVTDTATHTVHTNAVRHGMDDGRLFHLMTPIERWSSCYTDSHRAPAPRIDQTAGRIVLRLPSRPPAGGVCRPHRLGPLPPHARHRGNV